MSKLRGLLAGVDIGMDAVVRVGAMNKVKFTLTIYSHNLNANSRAAATGGTQAYRY